MNRAMVLLFGGFLGIFVSGCQSPKFTHNAPPAKLRAGGPSIVVMPLEDARTNRAIDTTFEKGYLTDIQKAIGDELRSAELFQSVLVVTNISDVPSTDLRLNPRLTRLAWEVPDYDSLLVKTFFISFLTGGIGGAIYISTGTDVYGHAGLNVELTTTSGASPAVNWNYTTSLTNHMAKASCDTSSTKADMTTQAFEQLMDPMKKDLQTRLMNTAPAISPETK